MVVALSIIRTFGPYSTQPVGGLLLIMNYTGTLRGPLPERLSFLGSKYGKGVPFSGEGMWKGANFQNLVCERVSIFQNLAWKPNKNRS